MIDTQTAAKARLLQHERLGKTVRSRSSTERLTRHESMFGSFATNFGRNCRSRNAERFAEYEP